MDGSIMPIVVKTVVAGATGYAISRLTGASGDSFGNFLGYNTSEPLATAMSAGGGTLIETTVASPLKASLPLNPMLGGAAVAGAGTSALTYASGGVNNSMSFVIGGLSNYVAEKVTEKWCPGGQCSMNYA